MKRKPTRAEEPVVSKEILEQAKLAAISDQIKPMGRCVVCGTECAADASEGLCWVCRRLKISAWRDSDMQIGMQE